MKTRAALFVCLLAWLGTAAACSDSDSDSKATTTTAPTGFEVQTPDGQASLSLSGQLPPNWPSDFPLPPDSEPAGSGSLGGSTSTGFVGVYSTTQSPQDAYGYYRSDAGLRVDSASSAGNGDAFVGTVEFSGDPSGWAVVLPYGGETLIVVLLSPVASDTTVGGSGTTSAT